MPFLALVLLLSACSSAAPVAGPSAGWEARQSSGPEDRKTPPRVASSFGSIPKGGGVYKVGNPYQVDGQWYVPKEQPGYDRSGMASWYGEDFHGRSTANGEVYDMNSLSAAHPTLPLPSYAYVTNLANGRTVMVRINDRGPYARGRIVDLSHAAAHALNMVTSGTTQVRVRYAGPAPLDGNDWKERRHLASQSWSGGSTRLADGQVPPGPRIPVASVREGAPSWSPEVYRAGLRSGLGRP